MKKFRIPLIFISFVALLYFLQSGRFAYQNAKIVADGPSTGKATQALKDLLNDRLMGKMAIKALLAKDQWKPFALEFRRRLYRSAYREKKNHVSKLLADDFDRLVVKAPDLLADGTLVRSFPFDSDPAFHDALAKWITSAREEDLPELASAIAESPPRDVASPSLAKALDRIVVYHRKAFENLKPGDGWLSFACSRIINESIPIDRIHFDLSIKSPPRVDCAAHVDKLFENAGLKSVALAALSDVRDYDFLASLHDRSKSATVRAAASHGMFHLGYDRALKRFTEQDDKATPSERKSITAHRLNHLPIQAFKGGDIMQYDSIFKAEGERLVMVPVYRLPALPSSKEYEAIVGHRYFATGKTFPIRIENADVQGAKLAGFIERYPWHPAVDDAHCRLAFIAMGKADPEKCLDEVSNALLSLDGDAGDIAKLLIAMIACTPEEEAKERKWPAWMRNLLKASPAGLASVVQGLDRSSKPSEIVFIANLCILRLHEITLSSQDPQIALQLLAKIRDLTTGLSLNPAPWTPSPLFWDGKATETFYRQICGSNRRKLSTAEVIDRLSGVKGPGLLILGGISGDADRGDIEYSPEVWIRMRQSMIGNSLLAALVSVANSGSARINAKQRGILASAASEFLLRVKPMSKNESARPAPIETQLAGWVILEASQNANIKLSQWNLKSLQKIAGGTYN